MTYALFIKGFVAGAFIAFPIGPIGIICLRRMITQGALMGLASGIGGATADILYALLALAGLSFVSTFLLQHSIALRVISGTFITLLGIKITQSNPPRPKPVWSGSVVQAYFSTFFLTLTNPLLILSFAALFGALDITGMSNYQNGIIFMLGLFIGSCFWWVLLALVTRGLRFSATAETFRHMNTISGCAIIFFGVLTLLSIAIK